MMSIDNFIQQLILLGLADSFLIAMEKHYLKLIEIYSLIGDIEEENVNKIDCEIDEENDILTVILDLKEREDNISEGYLSDEFNVQIINNANILTISVANNYRNEDDIYESRFARHRKANSGKWS